MKVYVVVKNLGYGLTVDQEKENAIKDKICAPLLECTNKSKTTKKELMKSTESQPNFIKCYKNANWCRFEGCFEGVIFVGTLDNYQKEISSLLNDEYKSRITTFLKKKNNIPVFPDLSSYEYETGRFAEQIKKLTFCREWDALFDEKNSEKMFTDYLQYNSDYKTVLESFLEKDDKVIIMDPDLWLLPSMITKKNDKCSVVAQIPFLRYEFFRCMYKNRDILQSLISSKLIVQNDDEEKLIRKICDITFLNFDQKSLDISVVPLVPQYVPEINEKIFKDYIQLMRRKYKKDVIITVLNDTNVEAFQSFLVAFDDLNKQKNTVLLILEHHDHKMTKEEKSELIRCIGYITKKHGSESIFHIAPTSNTEYFAFMSIAFLGVFIFEHACCNKFAMDFVSVNDSNFIVAENSWNLVKGIGVNPNDQDRLRVVLHESFDNRINPHHQKNIQTLQKLRGIDFVEEITKFKEKREMKEPGLLDEDEMKEKFQKAKTRALVLDYDGTLTEIVTRPDDAKPSEEIHQIMDKLLSIENTDVAICTGRKKEQIDEWFPDPRITIFAEHTAFKRTNGQWEKRNFDLSWMEETIEIMKDFQSSTPGSQIELKNSAVVFHYRKCDQEIGEIQAEECRKLLVHTLEGKATVKQGKCIVEVNALGITKDYSVVQFADREFKLCAGDDTTDEKMFEVEDFESVCIGKKKTLAKNYLETPAEFRRFLSKLN